MPANNFFFNAPDPLLSGGSNFNDVDSQIKEMERLQEELAQKQYMLQQSKQKMQQPSQPKSQSPVWDEIDSIMQGMSDQEFERVSSNEEFQKSQQNIMNILQSMQIQMIRPHVEASKEGKEALDYHLTLVKRLRNAVSKEVDEEINDFREYKEKYSDMSYADYQKMKREKGGKK